jgi:O-antigen/teichoic acid export membrane protein
MTVSNVIGPLMVSFDRFLIGAMISVSAVAYYAVPYEVVSRLGLFPIALVGVLFPAFSTTSVSDKLRLSLLYENGVKCIFLILFPILLILVVFAPEALRFWLGDEFARQSAPIVRILAVAILVNGIGQVPFSHVQGAGRPDITAKLHMFELPIYLLMLFFGAKTMGIQGVAIAWLARVVIDTGLLFVFSWRLLRVGDFVNKKLPLMMAFALILFGLAVLLNGIVIKSFFVVAVCLTVIAGAWRWLLSTHEKIALRTGLRSSVTKHA